MMVYAPELIDIAKQHSKALGLGTGQGISEPIEIKENNVAHGMIGFAIEILELSKGKMNKKQVLSALREARKRLPMKHAPWPKYLTERSK